MVFAPPLPSKLWTLHLAAQKTSLNGQIAGTFTADLFLCLVVARLLTFHRQPFSSLRQGNNEVHLQLYGMQKEHLVLHQTFGLFTTHTGKTT